jgi:type I restriction enzyme M protein
LFAQKKTKAQVEKWNELWHTYGKEWANLKTRVVRYYDYFVNDAALNKKLVWVKELSESSLKTLIESADKEAVESITQEDVEHIQINIKRFLKDYITPEDDELDTKELLNKYGDEISKLSKYENETAVFGFYNAWWVFGEVAKTSEIDYTIFMAEAENVGYKRTKRGENPMPNDLYDMEYAPAKLDCKVVIAQYEQDIKHNEDKKMDAEQERAALEEKNGIKENAATQKKIEKLVSDIESYAEKIATLQAEKAEVESILANYYENDSLKDMFSERTDTTLVSHFKNGLLQRYKSDDIVLRKTAQLTILDAIRQEVVWA